MQERLPFTKQDAMKWVSEHDTPFYVYDAAGIRKCALDLYEAFSWNEGFKEYFAVKATPTPAILRLLSELGCGADCASLPELMLAQLSGMKGRDIILSSNQTTDAEYRKAAEIGAYINLDDFTQIEHLERAAGLPDCVFLRYNPGECDNANEIMGHPADAKFGMTREQLFEGCKVLRDLGVRHFGLHSMLASCTLDNGYYPMLTKDLFLLALEIREKLSISIEFIDISGGIGIPYLPEEKAIDIFKVGRDLKELYDTFIQASGMKISLFTEMGRYMTGPYGYLITSVIGKKHIYKEYIGVDASAADLMRPAMYGSYHHIRVLGRENEPADQMVDVVGSLCENNDKFAVDRLLPHVEYGDLLVIEDAGAHGHAMGYNYNGKLRCAEFLMNESKELVMIRRKETLADYFATLDVDREFHYD